MGKRFAISIGAAALGAAVIAVGASATFRSVDDPSSDAKCFHEATPPAHRPCSDSTKRNAEIVSATADHEGRWLKHTIRVVGKFRHGLLLINTDQGAGCDFVLFIPGSAVRECDGSSTRTGWARHDFHLHSVEIFFSKGSIGFPRHYGWSALADAGSPTGHAVDFVPKRDAFRPATYSDRDLSYIRHQLR
jgi:hypothetical protein